MGTNIFLGEISYITKAISAVLQLGVTMDFAIFLYHSYIQEKNNFTSKEEAMSNAIRKTFTSVLGSSLTTIAGFLALCSMKRRKSVSRLMNALKICFHLNFHDISD